MTSDPGPRFPRTEVTQTLVDLLTAYLNSAGQLARLRANIAGPTERGRLAVELEEQLSPRPDAAVAYPGR